MDCPFRSNGDIRIFVLHSHKENGDAHMWHLRKDDGDTHDIYVTFAQGKMGQFHSKKRSKKVWQPTQHKGNVWNNKKQGGFYFK